MIHVRNLCGIYGKKTETFFPVVCGGAVGYNKEKERGCDMFDEKSYLKDLEYIVNIDSGTANVAGCRKIADFFACRFKEAGFHTQLLETGELKRPVVAAVTPQAEPPYEFYLGGHLDTVFPDGTAAERPFFTENGCAYGPGTIDMKSGALLILYLSEALIKTVPGVSLCILLNSDEEIGSPDSVQLLRERGSLCKRALIFEGGRKEGRLVNERKGIAKYHIHIKGIASHAGTAPQMGASAVVELAHWILKLDKLKNHERGTSVNVGIIEGGTALNVVAEESHGDVEVRYRQEGELARVERAFQRLCENPYVKGTQTRVTRLSHYPPLLLTGKTQKMMEELAPYHLEYVKAGGISDANRLAVLNIPIIDGCGPQGGFPHSEKEFLRIETVKERFDLFYDIIKQIGK